MAAILYRRILELHVRSIGSVVSGTALFPELRPEAKGRKVPDYEYLYKELARPNVVTLTLLYYECKVFKQLDSPQAAPSEG